MPAKMPKATAKMVTRKMGAAAKSKPARKAGKAGTVRTPAVSRGAAQPKRNGMGGTNVTTKNGLDAFSNAHLALPRPVSSYAVMRVTKRLDGNTAKAWIISPFNFQEIASQNGDSGNWTSVCALSADNLTSLVKDTNAWKRHVLPTNATTWSNLSLTPSACSVRVYNTQSLQVTAGMVTMGRISGECNWDGSSETIAQKFDNLHNYQNPVVLSAPELALKPRQIDAVPLDFGAVSAFTDYVNNLSDDTAFTWSLSNGTRPNGFTPIFIKNPQGVALNLEICVEFRVRFDPDSMMAPLQKHYAPASIAVWDKIMTDACEGNANGVRALEGH